MLGSFPCGLPENWLRKVASSCSSLPCAVPCLLVEGHPCTRIPDRSHSWFSELKSQWVGGGTICREPGTVTGVGKRILCPRPVAQKRPVKCSLTDGCAPLSRTPSAGLTESLGEREGRVGGQRQRVEMVQEC